MAALLAATIAVPAGAWFAGITALPLALIGTGVLFLPLFSFLPLIILFPATCGILPEREWYIRETIRHGLSRNELVHQV